MSYAIENESGKCLARFSGEYKAKDVARELIAGKKAETLVIRHRCGAIIWRSIEDQTAASKTDLQLAVDMIHWQDVFANLRGCGIGEAECENRANESVRETFSNLKREVIRRARGLQS